MRSTPAQSSSGSAASSLLISISSTEVDALFAANPWQGEGQAGPLQQLAFMVCYNIDAFRDYVQQHNLLAAFRLERDRRTLRPR